jgi:hypothetical protein
MCRRALMPPPPPTMPLATVTTLARLGEIGDSHERIIGGGEGRMGTGGRVLLVRGGENGALRLVKLAGKTSGHGVRAHPSEGGRGDSLTGRRSLGRGGDESRAGGGSRVGGGGVDRPQRR